ncbi:MAG: twin-arginine translocase subunit TatC [Nocardioidaceae bacterium]
MAFSLRRGQRAPAPVSADGTMTLMEHLRELRRRLVISVLAITIASIGAWFFYTQLFHLLTQPFYDAIIPLARSRHLNVDLALFGITDPFTLRLKVTFVTGLIVSSPIWLYEIWAFVAPGLHRAEKRWTAIFAGFAGPLFIGGVVIGYYILPKGINILIGFSPGRVNNIVTLSGYLSFVLRMLLVFGVAFEIPLFVVLLNLAGIVKGRQLGTARPWIITLTFVFAAVATPSTDPISMLFLAIPMTILFLVSEVIARMVDRRRGRSVDSDYGRWADDQESDLAVHHDPDDEQPSPLDDD